MLSELFLTFEQQVYKSHNKKKKNDFRAYKGTKAPEAPAFQGSQYQLNGVTKAQTSKVGNDVITNTNLTPEEKQSYDYLQQQLPSLYQGAIDTPDYTDYVNTFTNNQKTAVNRDFNDGLRTLKAQLTSSGQLGGSQGLDKLRPLQDIYMQSMQDIEANAPAYANDLLNAEIQRRTAQLGTASDGINQFYNTGNTFSNQATNLSKFGNDWANQDFQNRMTQFNTQQALNAQSKANTMNWIKTGVGAGLMFVPGAQGIGASMVAKGVKNL